jgi:uncharacterized protein YdeI (YjbR/CyaY-like superfamily)
VATTDQRVDAYITQAKPFAQPILKRIRAAFHQGCPKLEETLKWGNPTFMHEGILGGMAAFKQHVNFSFWRGNDVGDPDGILTKIGDTLMCQAKITDLSECPSQAVLAKYVKRAVKANEAAAKAPSKSSAKRATKPAPKMPPDLASALKKSKKAKATFDGFSPSHKREYIEWVTEAKKDETRARRIVQAIELMTEGKSKNWKYERPKKTSAKKKAAKKKAAKKKPAKKKPAKK